ncbi:MAG TPA: ribonuclease III [Candidatus Paceibacterota bacterium]
MDLEKRIGVNFKNKDLLKEALTHRSYLNEHPEWALPHNERLEFLGDAVLELVVTEYLYNRFPDKPEGQLTMLRAALVNYQFLSKITAEFDLDGAMLMSRGERADNSKAREVILANAIESLIGAIYLDQGFEVAKNFIHRFVIEYLPEILETKSYKDAKSELQEIVQEKLRVTPNYKVLGESGPAHKRVFRIGVYFGEKLMAEGEGSSKQEGEIEAARMALKKYK